MAERGNLQAKLNAGIEAVHAGDRVTAKKLLQQVIRADPGNEIAWMWMASAVTNPAERRACLERALEINPSNSRAKEALRRLELTGVTQADSSRLLAGLGSPRRPNIYLILAVVVGIVVVAAIIFTLVNATQSNNVNPNINAGLSGTGIPAINLAPTTEPTIDPTTFTATPMFAVVVTIDRSQNPLPATFTPTFTPLPSATPMPTATPPPLNTYALLYNGVDAGQTAAQLYRVLAEGSDSTSYPIVDGGYRDMVVDPSGQRVAFVRDVFDTSLAPPETAPLDATADVGTGMHPELFVGPLADPGSATQITYLPGTKMARPSWSPDGSQIAFASDADGDLNVYVIPATGGTPVRLTSNRGTDKDPAWSPDGARIAYASDQSSPAVNQFPGTTEIFVIPADGSGAPEQLTDAGGGSFWPSWSPDGKHIVFASDRSGDGDLYIMSDQGEGQDLITFDDQGAEDRAPAYSPDGRWIVFSSNRETPNFQVYLIDIKGNIVQRVTQNDRDVQAVSFLPSLP